MDRVRLGLIGMGLIGTPHARTLQKVEDCELVAVADVDEKRRALALMIDQLESAPEPVKARNFTPEVDLSRG